MESYVVREQINSLQFLYPGNVNQDFEESDDTD